jgi:hypothetical protein
VFDNLKPRLKSGIFKYISWLNGSYFGGWWSGSSEREGQEQMTPMSPIFFFSLNIPLDYLLLDSAPNIGPLISRWELDNFKNCWNKSFGTSKILTFLCQQFSNLLISQRNKSGPRLGALSHNRWSGGIWSKMRRGGNMWDIEK